jgi:hypothetical protein
MTIDEIKEANQEAGQHWFSKGAMRFFNCSLGRKTFGRYFVTGERQKTFSGNWADVSGPRRFTLRRCQEDGTIKTIGEFQQYDTRKEAEKEARKCWYEERGL